MNNAGYYMDISAFTIDKLRNQLKHTRLLPSQQILGEHIDERFDCLEGQGIENLQQLQKVLKTKSAVQSFALTSGLPVDYLTILRREVNSYRPKPINLKDFPGVDPGVIHKLGGIGIKHTLHLFPYVLTPEDRAEFARQNRIEYEDILELTKLTDVARMKWVGPKFARLLIESEYDTVEKVAHSNYDELHHTLQRVNEEGGYYKGNIGADDMKIWVDVVQDVPQVIHYE